MHLQDSQYKYGQQINQAAVGLLQYPLEMQGLSTDIKRNDLLYYESVTKVGDSFRKVIFVGSRILMVAHPVREGRRTPISVLSRSHSTMEFMLTCAQLRCHSQH